MNFRIFALACLLMVALSFAYADSQKDNSDAYWRGEARPIAILEHSLSGNNLTLVAQNVEADNRSLASIEVAGAGRYALYSPPTNETVFPAGEKRKFLIPLNCTLNAGDRYAFNLTFSYAAPSSSAVLFQAGKAPLIGYSSQAVNSSLPECNRLIYPKSPIVALSELVKQLEYSLLPISGLVFLIVLIYYAKNLARLNNMVWLFKRDFAIFTVFNILCVYALGMFLGYFLEIELALLLVLLPFIPISLWLGYKSAKSGFNISEAFFSGYFCGFACVAGFIALAILTDLKQILDIPKLLILFNYIAVPLSVQVLICGIASAFSHRFLSGNGIGTAKQVRKK